MSAVDQPPSTLLPDEAPESVGQIVDQGFSQDPEEAAQQEHDAVFYLLSPPKPIFWETDVKYETPEGTATFAWQIRSLKPTEIDEPERRYLKAAGGAAEDVDDIGIACELIVKATTSISNKATGTTVDLNSQQFRAGIPSAAEALRIRFEYQAGVLVMLANEVRRISGWGPDRVGQARRVLVDVAGKP